VFSDYKPTQRGVVVLGFKVFFKKLFVFKKKKKKHAKFYFCPAYGHSAMQHLRYDEFGFIIEDDFPEASDTDLAPAESGPTEPHLPMRTAFPAAGSAYLGGQSDGWRYETVFGGSRLETTYAMLRQFLEEEGYGDVPVPATAADLQLFRRQRTAQLQFFPERGYVHNPIKILFHPERGQRNSLILCIFNEQMPDHLLRFHGVLRPPA
jgi:hypothetical protein